MKLTLQWLQLWRELFIRSQWFVLEKTGTFTIQKFEAFEKDILPEVGIFGLAIELEGNAPPALAATTVHAYMHAAAAAPCTTTKVTLVGGSTRPAPSTQSTCAQTTKRPRSCQYGTPRKPSHGRAANL